MANLFNNVMSRECAGAAHALLNNQRPVIAGQVERVHRFISFCCYKAMLKEDAQPIVSTFATALKREVALAYCQSIMDGVIPETSPTAWMQLAALLHAELASVLGSFTMTGV